MTHPAASEDHTTHASELALAPPWRVHPAWPFDEQCWTERTTEHWTEALSEACEALDTDQPLESSIPPELPRMQKLYVLSNLLMLFLQSMPDGIITETMWTRIEAYLIESEKSKRKLSPDDQRTAILEILSQAPPHSISFILITTMLERIVLEIAGTGQHEERPMSPSKARSGTLKRMTTAMGRLPAAPASEVAIPALARCFADAVVRSPAPASEKARAAQERRKIAVLEMFLRKDEMS